MDGDAIDKETSDDELREEPATPEQSEVSEPSVLEPPVLEPPVLEPPVLEPPVLEPPVLELRGVTFGGQRENEIQLTDATFQLSEGELAVVTLEDSTTTRAAVSMIQGLTSPFAGEVLFCGRDWLGKDHDSHFQMRSRIGRVFDGQAWIENLNINENVTLSRRHHGASILEIEDDVKFWLANLEIAELSGKRPAFVEPSILQLHQWIRAFLGSPALVILERPLKYLSATWIPKLADAIAELRRRGTAVLWFSDHRDSEIIDPVAPTHWHVLKDGQLQAMQGGGNHA